MEEEKIPKRKPHSYFKRRLPVVKKPEGNMTTSKKNFKNFILQGEHDKGGNMAKGITVYWYSNILNIFGKIIKTFSLIIGVGDKKIFKILSQKLNFHIPTLGNMIIWQQ